MVEDVEKVVSRYNQLRSENPLLDERIALEKAFYSEDFDSEDWITLTVEQYHSIVFDFISNINNTPNFAEDFLTEDIKRKPSVIKKLEKARLEKHQRKTRQLAGVSKRTPEAQALRKKGITPEIATPLISEEVKIGETITPIETPITPQPFIVPTIETIAGLTDRQMTPVASSFVKGVGAYKGHLLIEYHHDPNIWGYPVGGERAGNFFNEIMMSGSKGGWVWDKLLGKPSQFGMAKGKFFAYQDPNSNEWKYYTSPGAQFVHLEGRPAKFTYNPVGYAEGGKSAYEQQAKVWKEYKEKIVEPPKSRELAEAELIKQQQEKEAKLMEELRILFKERLGLDFIDMDENILRERLNKAEKYMVGMNDMERETYLRALFMDNFSVGQFDFKLVEDSKTLSEYISYCMRKHPDYGKDKCVAIAHSKFGKSKDFIESVYDSLVEDAKDGRPPKEWWDNCYAKIKKENPNYTDEQIRGTCGKIYHQMGVREKIGDLINDMKVNLNPAEARLILELLNEVSEEDPYYREVVSRIGTKIGHQIFGTGKKYPEIEEKSIEVLQKGKGRGWHGESERHSQAAKTGKADLIEDTEEGRWVTIKGNHVFIPSKPLIKEMEGGNLTHKHDFIDFSNFKTDFSEDYTHMYGPISHGRKGGHFDYRDPNDPKKMIRVYKDYGSLKEATNVDYFPIIGKQGKGSHKANVIGFTYGFEPKDETEEIYAHSILFNDLVNISDIPIETKRQVSIGFNDDIVGDIQYVKKIDHLAMSLDNDEIGNCAMGGKSCFMEIKEDMSECPYGIKPILTGLREVIMITNQKVV